MLKLPCQIWACCAAESVSQLISLSSECEMQLSNALRFSILRVWQLLSIFIIVDQQSPERIAFAAKYWSYVQVMSACNHQPIRTHFQCCNQHLVGTCTHAMHNINVLKKIMYLHICNHGNSLTFAIRMPLDANKKTQCNMFMTAYRHAI